MRTRERCLVFCVHKRHTKHHARATHLFHTYSGSCCFVQSKSACEVRGRCVFHAARDAVTCSPQWYDCSTIQLGDCAAMRILFRVTLKDPHHLWHRRGPEANLRLQAESARAASCGGVRQHAQPTSRTQRGLAESLRHEEEKNGQNNVEHAPHFLCIYVCDRYVRRKS